MDLLSDVFERLRVGAGLYFTTDFSGHWGVTLPQEDDTIRFHLVTHGECWVRLEGPTSPPTFVPVSSSSSPMASASRWWGRKTRL